MFFIFSCAGPPSHTISILPCISPTMSHFDFVIKRTAALKTRDTLAHTTCHNPGTAQLASKCGTQPIRMESSMSLPHRHPAPCRALRRCSLSLGVRELQLDLGLTSPTLRTSFLYTPHSLPHATLCTPHSTHSLTTLALISGLAQLKHITHKLTNDEYAPETSRNHSIHSQKPPDTV